MADRPSNTGREDTVALPLPPKRPAQGSSNGSPSGSTTGSPTGSNGSHGKVLPPMPSESADTGSRNGSATPPPPPAPPRGRAARPAAKKTAKQPARPKPTDPPAQARKAAATKAAKKAAPAAPAGPPPSAAAAAAAAAASPAAPVGQPSPATQSQLAQAPAARTTETARPAAAPPPVVAAPPAAKSRPVRDPKPTRADKLAERAAATPRPSRRARLRLTRIDPWSIMKTSFLLSIALGIVIVVSVLMVWTVLDAADVWDSINQTVRDVVGGQDASTFDIEDYLGTRRVVGFTMIVAAVDVVLVTAICTLGAFLYNMSASLLGGVEVTLAEDN